MSAHFIFKIYSKDRFIPILATIPLTVQPKKFKKSLENALESGVDVNFVSIENSVYTIIKWEGLSIPTLSINSQNYLVIEPCKYIVS